MSELKLFGETLLYRRKNCFRKKIKTGLGGDHYKTLMGREGELNKWFTNFCFGHISTSGANYPAEVIIPKMI